MTRLQSNRSLIIALAWALAALLGQLHVGNKLRQNFELLRRATDSSPQYFRRDANFLRLTSFGQIGVVIDWLWVLSLQDPELKHVTPGQHPPAFYLLDTITTLDPAFYEAYSHGARTLSVVRNDGPGAQIIVKRGEHFIRNSLSSMPQRFRDTYWTYSWDLSVLRAYIEFFDLLDMTAASQAYRRAAEIPGVPQYVHDLVRRLSTTEGRFAVASATLFRQIEASKKDELALQRLQKKARDLGIAHFLYKAESAFKGQLAGIPPTNLLQRQEAWAKFKKANPQWARDPEGGEVRLEFRPRTQLTTSTPEYKELFPSNQLQN